MESCLRSVRRFIIAGKRASSEVPVCPNSDLLLFSLGRVSPRSIGTTVAMVGSALYSPFSKGSVRLASNDLHTNAIIDFRMLDDPRDASRVVKGARFSETPFVNQKSRNAITKRSCCQRRCRPIWTVAGGNIKVMPIISNLLGITLAQSAEKKPASRMGRKEALRRYTMAATKLHVDDTLIPVLSPANRKICTSRLWVVRDDHRSGSAQPASVWFAYLAEMLDLRPPY